MYRLNQITSIINHDIALLLLQSNGNLLLL